MSDPNHRIKYRKGDFELELQGPREWVEAKFKELTTVDLVKPLRGGPLTAPSHETVTGFPESLAEFVKSKGSPDKHSVLVVVFGYWLRYKENQQSFNTRDMKKCYDDARIQESSNTSQYMNEAQKDGFFKRVSERKDNQVTWTITQTGDKFVTGEEWQIVEETGVRIEKVKNRIGRTSETVAKPSRKQGPGGSRSNIISKAIDGLISEGWLDKAKTVSEVSNELERKTVPGVTLKSVSEALRRRARSGTLDRIKGASKEYTYVKKT